MSSPAPHRPARRSGHRATLLIAGAGLAVFGFYLVVVTGGGALAPLDGELLSLTSDLGARIPRGALVRVTDLGALPVAVLLVLVAAALLAVSGRPGAAVALALGFLATFVAVDLVKQEVGRPRPPALRPSPTTDSFPSGHAAYATAWTAVAVTFARLSLTGLRRWLRLAAVGGGCRHRSGRSHAASPRRPLLVRRRRRVGARPGHLRPRGGDGLLGRVNAPD